jgi:hypothetical protein
VLTSNNKDNYTADNSNAANNDKNKNKPGNNKSTNNAIATTANNAVVKKATSHSVADANKKLNNNNLENNNSSVAVDKAKTNNTNTGHTAASNNKPAANKITPSSGLAGNLNNTAGANKPGRNKKGTAHGNTPAANAVAATEPANNNTAADSIPKITVNQKMTIDHRTNEAHYTQSVMSVGKAPMPAAERPANSIPSEANNYNNPRYVASAANGGVNEVAANAAILPASAAEVKTSSNKSNLGLAASTQKKRKGDGWDFSAVSQFIKDVKYNLGQVSYSTGLTGGFNMLFLGGNTIPGFQLGATETFGISDHFSIMTELKYFQNFNNKMTVNDNYTLYKNVGNEWTKDSMSHYYKFSTLQSLSLPVTLQYNVGRFNIIGGPSFSYIMGISPEPVDLAIPEYHRGGINAPTQQELDASGARINADNFVGRFSIGYIVGFSYQFAPKLSVDARLNQNIWDNASAPGAKLVSDKLYKKPGLQLSVGYNLSKDKKH